MRHANVTLDDKYLLETGRVFITGVQALGNVGERLERLEEAGARKIAAPEARRTTWHEPEPAPLQPGD